MVLSKLYVKAFDHCNICVDMHPRHACAVPLLSVWPLMNHAPLQVRLRNSWTAPFAHYGYWRFALALGTMVVLFESTFSFAITSKASVATEDLFVSVL